MHLGQNSTLKGYRLWTGWLGSRSADHNLEAGPGEQKAGHKPAFASSAALLQFTSYALK